MAVTKSKIQHISGIPLGGIGTGSVEIQQDGYFYEWQIHNQGQWSPGSDNCSCQSDIEIGPDALSFHLRARKLSGEPMMRRLGMRSDQHDLQALSWHKSVEEIEYEGKFPLATLKYLDQDLPVSIEAVMFSPFLPHQSKISGTPGFYMCFKIRNRSDEPVEASVLGIQKNLIAIGLGDRDLHNSVSNHGPFTTLLMETNAGQCCNATSGSLALSVSGGENSYISGEFSKFFNGYICFESEFGTPHESIYHGFRETGRLPDSISSESPALLLDLNHENVDSMTPDMKIKLLDELKKNAFVHDMLQNYLRVDSSLLECDAGISAVLKEIALRLDILSGKNRQSQSWGDGALASLIHLDPGEEKEIRFTLSWFFPNHFNPGGIKMGHMYENWFADAAGVNEYLTDNYASIHEQVVSFSDTLHQTSLSGIMAETWANQLTTLIKCTWWTKRDDFAVWEGLGCCGLHTTDITYQGSFPIISLFPELQKRQMEMGARFQRDDGRVHHMFLNDLSVVDDGGYKRIDMNNQFVLLVCRDYLWTGDLAYVIRLWPNIIKALEDMAKLDADGDGLPDHDTQWNTYDLWHFFGTPSYVACLWLAALTAGVRLARDVGDDAHLCKWQDLYEKGVANFDNKLWNGQYYSLWVDEDERDECCLIDQIDGEWFTNLIGLGHFLPETRILQVLTNIHKFNFKEEDGLIMASYPPGKKLKFYSYRNFQSVSPFTGIEYTVASMMLEFGLVKQAEEIIDNIYRRYVRVGRIWNHQECGEHYYRAMNSWSILLSATGFKLDVPNGKLTIAPIDHQGQFHAPWFSSTGWGQFSYEDTRFELTCRSGSVCFITLCLKASTANMQVSIDDKPVTHSLVKNGAIVELHFEEEINLMKGQTLVITLSPQ